MAIAEIVNTVNDVVDHINEYSQHTERSIGRTSTNEKIRNAKRIIELSKTCGDVEKIKENHEIHRLIFELVEYLQTEDNSELTKGSIVLNVIQKLQDQHKS